MAQDTSKRPGGTRERGSRPRGAPRPASAVASHPGSGPAGVVNAPRHGFQAEFDASRYNRYYLMAGWDEAQVQRMVVERLRAMRFVVEEVDAGLKAVRAVLRQRGLGGLPAVGRKGLPDLVGCSPTGRGLFIEVKRPLHISRGGVVLAAAGRATPEQLAFLSLVHGAGAIAGVTWGVPDLDGILRPWPLNGV